MNARYLWISYLVGALLSLAWKWARWCRTGATPPLCKNWRVSTREWLDASLLCDKFSWATTIGVVWMIGCVFIQNVKVPWDWLQYVPVHYSTAFLLGSLMEFIAPALVKWILSKFPNMGM